MATTDNIGSRGHSDAVLLITILILFVLNYIKRKFEM